MKTVRKKVQILRKVLEVFYRRRSYLGWFGYFYQECTGNSGFWASDAAMFFYWRETGSDWINTTLEARKTDQWKGLLSGEVVKHGQHDDFDTLHTSNVGQITRVRLECAETRVPLNTNLEQKIINNFGPVTLISTAILNVIRRDQNIFQEQYEIDL